MTGHCRVYEALNVNTAGTGSDTRRALGGRGGVAVEESVIIQRPIAELYRFWRNLENLPRFMRHLESVERITDTLSRWRARGPGGTIVEWSAKSSTTSRTRSSAGAPSKGPMSSAPDPSTSKSRIPGTTRLRVKLQYSPPGGKVGVVLAKLFGRDAATEIREDLRRFKQLVETGEKV